MDSIYLISGQTLRINKSNPNFLNPDNFRPIEWFRPPDYQNTNDSYGVYTGTYEIKRTLRLLNLGDQVARDMVLQHTDLTQYEFDADQQYSGDQGNMIVHEAILESPYFDDYDGTILTKKLINDSLLEYLEGAEEVCLFTERNQGALSLIS